MDVTACTVTETGMSLTIEITLTDGETTTQDVHTEQSSRWLQKTDLIAWANQTLTDRWGVKVEWFAPEPEWDRIVLEAAIGLPEEEYEASDEFYFEDGEVPEGWTSMSDD